MQAVTSHTKQAIYDEWFDAKFYERYFRSLKKRYRNYTIGLKITGAIAIPLALFPHLSLIQEFNIPTRVLGIIELLAIALLILLYVVDRTFKLSTKYDVLDPVISGCSSFEVDVKELWDKTCTKKISENEAFIRCILLTRGRKRLADVPDKFILDHKRLVDECSKEARTELTNYIERETPNE